MPFSLSNFRYLPRVLQMAHKNLYNGNTVNPREQSAEKGMKYGFFSAKNREKKDVAFSSDIGVDLGTATVLVM